MIDFAHKIAQSKSKLPACAAGMTVKIYIFDCRLHVG